MTMLFKKKCIEIKQDEIEILITAMSPEELINNTKPDVYHANFSPDGYQRPITPTHVNAIVNYLSTEQYAILPTAIILAIDGDKLHYDSKKKTIEFTGQFRIVDGQHRIEAMRKWLQELSDDIELEKGTSSDTETQLEEIRSWMYPVNIMKLKADEDWERYVEIRAFVDINKKGKTVATDLADNNIGKIRIKLDALPYKQTVQQISIEVAKNLMSNQNSVWFNSIRTGDGDDDGKMMGIGMFSKSITSLVGKYVINKYGKLKRYERSMVTESVNVIANNINKLWDVVAKRWDLAFKMQKDLSYRPDDNYAIQKGIGVFPMHKIFTLEYSNTSDFDVSLERTKKILELTCIEADDWKIGATFSPYNSGSGFNKIVKVLKNELPLSRT